MRFLRLFRIFTVTLRFGLDEFILSHTKLRPCQRLLHGLLFWRDVSQPRGVRLRMVLASIGAMVDRVPEVLIGHVTSSGDGSLGRAHVPTARE